MVNIEYCRRMMVNQNNIFVIYLAGPFRGNFFVKRYNIWRAKQYAKILWKHNVAVICPHTNSGFIDNKESDKFILPANIDIMLRCDALLLMKKYKKSVGTCNEKTLAILNGLPTYYSIRALLNDIKERYKSN